MLQVESLTVEMKRLLLIPLFALVLTLASSWYVWNPYTWGIESLEHGYPLLWLTSFTSVLGGHEETNWAINAVNFSVDYLFWLAVSAAGILSFTLAQWNRIAPAKVAGHP